MNYFSHDSNARNSDKIIPLRMKMNAEGYGIYFMILERLREEPDYMSIKDYNMLAFDFRVSSDKVKAVIEDFGLFSFAEDGKRFYSESFLKRMAQKDEKSEKARNSANSRWDKVKNDANAQEKKCERNANAQKNDAIKKSKVKKSKVKDICRETRPQSLKNDFENFIFDFNKIRGTKFQAIEKVKKQFNGRLKEGFTPAQMLQAYENAMKDKYHAETEYKYLTPEFFTRADKIDKFLNQVTSQSNGSAPIDDWKKKLLNS